MHEDHRDLLKLFLCGGAVAPKRSLLDAHGTATRSLAAGASAWRAAGLSEAQVRALRKPDLESLQRALDWLDHPRHHLLGWHQPDYPPLLRRINSPPLALFVDGDPSLLWHAGVAIVGSRSPTGCGRDNARAFARAFAAVRHLGDQRHGGRDRRSRP